MKTYDFTISYGLAVAMLNDDRTGLTDDDERAIEAWYEKHKIGWAIVPDDAEILEAQCEITKLWGECVKVTGGQA